MSTPTPVLTSQETELLGLFRSLPGVEAQARVAAILRNLAFYLATPRCQGMLAEGFPCGEPQHTCEECHEIWDVLEQLEKVIPAKG